eukprot:jgi/Chlat1/1415/Chrsp12S01987
MSMRWPWWLQQALCVLLLLSRLQVSGYCAVAPSQFELLTSNNFSQVLAGEASVLCVFTVPWCGLTRKLLGDIKNAQRTKPASPGLLLRAVHCHQVIDDPLLREHCTIVQAPILKLLRNNKSYEYSGPYVGSAVLSAFAAAASLQGEDIPTKYINSAQELLQLVSQADVAVVAFDRCQSLALFGNGVLGTSTANCWQAKQRRSLIDGLAAEWLLRAHHFAGQVTDFNLLQELQIPPSVSHAAAVFRAGMRPLVHMGNASSLETWLRKYATPLLPEAIGGLQLRREDFATIFQKERPLVLLFVNRTAEDHVGTASSAAMAAVREVAAAYLSKSSEEPEHPPMHHRQRQNATGTTHKERIRAADCSKSPRFMHMDLLEEDPLPSRLGVLPPYPAVTLVDIPREAHYIMPRMLPITAASVGTFVNEVCSGHAKRYVRSQPVSEARARRALESGVHYITARGLSSLLSGGPTHGCRSGVWNAPVADGEAFIDTCNAQAMDRDIFVMFYMTWCGYCKRMDYVFQQLQRELLACGTHAALQTGGGGRSCWQCAARGINANSQRCTLQSSAGPFKQHNNNATDDAVVSVIHEDASSEVFEMPLLLKMDCDDNECTPPGLEEVGEYPTLVLYPACKWEQPVVYFGPTEVQSVLAFLAKFASANQTLTSCLLSNYHH